MTFVWIAIAVLGLLLAVCLLALVDQYRTLELIRARLKLEDNPEPIQLPVDRLIAPSAIGLPAELDSEPYLVLLFLSTSCTTCRSIADGLRKQNSSNLWVVLQQAHSEAEGAQWLANMGIAQDRSTVDVSGDVAVALEIDVIPSVAIYRNGEPLLAQTIPSFRQLTPLLSPHTMPRSVMKEGTVRT
ncbi:thioredoxin domain-containing protein [Fodinicola feengrottensis]|uniref:Thioredoxin domain-containing protein n=1 Tax=Fodinicola feengrottensis TaxID=435914 RepID=A0ABP4UI05_9ACTN|nr:hypothetical protein [Fodinicola feengrottensis]